MMKAFVQIPAAQKTGVVTEGISPGGSIVFN
jgi:hypothetical protein